jgi:hypothetical protein
MENKYQNGKIYKIVDYTNNNVYIGSTCKTLNRRLQYHLSDYKRYLINKDRYLSSFEILKNNDYKIELIELYPCNDKNELLIKERYWTNQEINCINKLKNQGIWNEIGKKECIKEQKKEYYENNKKEIGEKYKLYRDNNQEKLKERSKKYREKNKEEIKLKKSEQHLCLCGSYYTIQHKSRHERTIKHQTFINNNNN